MKLKKKRKCIVLFVLPAFVLYTLFMIYPIFTSMKQSLYVLNDSRELIFAGFSNYIDLLTDPGWREQLLRALGNSFKFFLINMLIQNPVALLIAALLSAKTKGTHVYRTILYLPVVLSLVMVAFVWQMLLNPTWGIAEDFLSLFGLEGAFAPWLGQESTALNTMALISAWQNLGVPILLYYSTLIQIPGELIEASAVDGCSGIGTFFRIKLPMTMPMVATVSLMTYIFNFNAFDLIYAIKGPLAGPNFSTDTMMSFFFRTFYGHELQQPNAPMGAAIACIILFILMGGVVIYQLWSRQANKRLE
ncbi:sugar ABC transporter permease [Lachnospiraceae bacterium KGMB03038]|nr:sugar ABC transporter permease [Lachnospiraceae bacterium KGMB03038]